MPHFLKCPNVMSGRKCESIYLKGHLTYCRPAMTLQWADA